ncbi:MAG: fluoride efflux transporter CrcB [Aquificae bacterium]|nr:fluoride efflux transporter CrcB [Aquificota bacterium]
MLWVILGVCVGGALGSLFRFLISGTLQAKLGTNFPVGTLTVNLVGAFLIGFLFGAIPEKLISSPHLRALLITGFLGGFTTFSAFAYESVALLKEGNLKHFFLYVFITNAFGVILTLLGYRIGREV